MRREHATVIRAPCPTRGEKKKTKLASLRLAESDCDRASVVYCAPIIRCQGVLLWGWQALSTRPNWLVCSCPPKGPELNLLVMASISWLDKIPLFLSPFPSLSLYSFPAQELSSDCITQLGWGSCPLTLFLFIYFLFLFFRFFFFLLSFHMLT